MKTKIRNTNGGVQRVCYVTYYRTTPDSSIANYVLGVATKALGELG